MLKNIIEFMRKKYVGVDLFNGNVKAFEKKDNTYINKSIEEIYPNVLNIKTNGNYWCDFDAMKQLLTYVLNNTKKSLFSPTLLIAIPFEIFELNNKELIFDAALQSKWSNIYIIDNFICSAIGSGVDVNEAKRKIFVYCLNNLTYVGLIFAGGVFNVNILEKGYNELTEIDIKSYIEKLLNEVSIQLPKKILNPKLPQKVLEEVVRGWALEIERKIYLSIPLDFKNRLGLNIGIYELVYLEHENSILEGLKKIISKL